MVPTRRSIMITSCAALALKALGGPVAAGPADAATRLRAVVGDPGSGRLVGEAYLSAHPAEAAPEWLPRALLRSIALDEGSLSAEDDASLRARIAQQIRKDFAQGDVASVRGWVLSRTEARLCGLWA